MRSTFRFLPFLFNATACTALIATVGTIGLPPLRAKAQELPPLPIQFNPETLRSPGRPGGRRRGGGSRGECGAHSVPLSAIAYADSQSSRALGVDVVEESVGSFTTQAQPLLWFYMPEAISEGNSAELIVQNEREEIVYRGQLEGRTDKDGIIHVPLAVEMAPGSAYRWVLSLDCGDTAAESVSGWVVRQNAGPNVARLFAQAEPHNRVALYANYGYLQDALSELAMLRLANLDDEELARSWIGFLSGLGLEDLMAAPILDCCRLGDVDADVPGTEEVVEESAEEPAEELAEEPVEASTEEPVEEIAPVEREENSVRRESTIDRVRRRGRSPLDR